DPTPAPARRAAPGHGHERRDRVGGVGQEDVLVGRIDPEGERADEEDQAERDEPARGHGPAQRPGLPGLHSGQLSPRPRAYGRFGYVVSTPTTSRTASAERRSASRS